jgi:short-chain Z-isoprenyl diphosphate synthase
MNVGVFSVLGYLPLAKATAAIFAGIAEYGGLPVESPMSPPRTRVAQTDMSVPFRPDAPPLGKTGSASAPFIRARKIGSGLGRALLRLVYYIYERRLGREVARRSKPRHIGIILDGNRRHGRSHGITEPREMYDLGAEKLDEVLAWCAELTIPAVTLWVFSTDNFRRPPAEISGIFAAVAAKLNRLARDPAIHERRVRVRAIGCLRLLPQPVLDAIAAAERATAGYDGMELNIALAYGGREEIADAVQALLNELTAKRMSLADAIQRITPEAIGRHLYTAGLPDPDLIIRTSGEVRLSGFLLWQSAHSEFYFTDVLWPAFRKIDFLRAIRSFQQRQRRFGG